MIGLLVLLALCIAALLFFKKQSASDPLSQTRVDASADIEAALERLTQDGDTEAELVTAAPDTTAQKALLVFEGVSSADDIQEIIDLLRESGMDATFFFSGLDVLNYPDAVALPMDEGFSIGNSGYSSNANMET
jgi:peptidoglycan/xylan/chitin deacetylase (PgdA/CDA1 family)